MLICTTSNLCRECSLNDCYSIQNIGNVCQDFSIYANRLSLLPLNFGFGLMSLQQTQRSNVFLALGGMAYRVLIPKMLEYLFFKDSVYCYYSCSRGVN